MAKLFEFDGIKLACTENVIYWEKKEEEEADELARSTNQKWSLHSATECGATVKKATVKHRPVLAEAQIKNSHSTVQRSVELQ